MQIIMQAGGQTAGFIIIIIIQSSTRHAHGTRETETDGWLMSELVVCQENQKKEKNGEILMMTNIKLGFVSLLCAEK